MGAVLQTAGAAELAAELTCCACSSVCGLVTRDSATRAKFRYCSFLLFATVTCIILLIPGLRFKLDKIPSFCSKIVSSDTCDKFVGFAAVYRILTALALFHFVLAILTIKVTRVKSFRAKFNNGLWFFKMGLIFALTILLFSIPKKAGIFRIWMYISMTAGFVFIMFQIMLIIDFGHSWSLSWAEKLESGHAKLWYAAMAFVTLFMFSLSCGALITFYIYFTHAPDIHKCHANVFYISFVGMQCFLAVLVSVTPSVQQELTGAGLLQSSVVVLYTMYLTWNTLSSEPDSTCNPLGSIILEYDSLTGVSGEAIFGCAITLILLLFACTVRANTSHLGKYGLALAESEDFAMSTYKEDKARANVEKRLESGEKEVSLDEYVGYNYSFFHMVMSIGSLYILMILTNWHSPEENSDLQRLVKNWASVWVQMASSFVCSLIYVWFLVTPLVKRVWGPTFGIILEDEQYEDETPTKLKSSQNGFKKDVNAVESFNHGTDNKDKGFNCIDTQPGKMSKRYTPDHLVKHEVKPPSRNTFDSNVSNRKKPRLKKVFSEESFDSEISIKLKVTSQSKKLQDSRQNDQNTKNDTHQRRNSGTSIREDGNALKAKRKLSDNFKDHIESDRESIISYLSCNTRTIQEKLTKEQLLRISETTSNEPHYVKPRKESFKSSAESLNYETEKKHDVKSYLKCAIQNKIEKNIEKSIEDEPSLVPSVFKVVEQDHDTAREILKLQWKILRTQAKVVKVQERIIKLQEESNKKARNFDTHSTHSKQKKIVNKEPG